MKIYNLTDVATPALVAAGLVGVPIHVGGGVTVVAGESVVVPKATGIGRFIKLGALFVGNDPPAEYKAKRKPAPKAEPAVKPEAKAEVKPKAK